MYTECVLCRAYVDTMPDIVPYGDRKFEFFHESSLFESFAKHSNRKIFCSSSCHDKFKFFFQLLIL